MDASQFEARFSSGSYIALGKLFSLSRESDEMGFRSYGRISSFGISHGHSLTSPSFGIRSNPQQKWSLYAIVPLPIGEGLTRIRFALKPAQLVSIQLRRIIDARQSH